MRRIIEKTNNNLSIVTVTYMNAETRDSTLNILYSDKLNKTW